MGRIGTVSIDKDIKPPCWIWTGWVDKDGYARSNGKILHRVFYEEKYGKVPPGLTLDHTCNTRCCVNPDHMKPVTIRVNTQRASKVSEMEVLAIIEKYKSGMKQKDIAKEYDISQCAVSHYVRGERRAL